MFNLNFLYLCNITYFFIYKIFLIFLNNLYFSFFILFILYFSFFKSNFNFILFFIFLTYKIYFLELQNLNLLKDVYKIETVQHFSFELLVGLVSIHPLLFYYGLVLSIHLFVCYLIKNINVYNNIKTNIAVLILALFLGGFWG